MSNMLAQNRRIEREREKVAKKIGFWGAKTKGKQREGGTEKERGKSQWNSDFSYDLKVQQGS